MDKKNTRATAFQKIITQAKKTQAANRPITEKKATIPDEILERAKASVIKVKNDTNASSLSVETDMSKILKHDYRESIYDKDAIMINPDVFNPYLDASASPLPVSHEVISFIYSLDGRAEGAKSTSDYDEQWNKDKCIFTSWRPFFPYPYCFIDKEILEIDKSLEDVTGIHFKHINRDDTEKRKKNLGQISIKDQQGSCIEDFFNKEDLFNQIKRSIK